MLRSATVLHCARGMAIGGMAMGAGRGYKVGGKIDGCAKRGRTNCKMR